MRFPAHFNITLSASDKADLRAARQAFIASMEGLSEEDRVRRARVTASGIRASDPYTKALASQFVEAADAKAKVFKLQSDLEAVKKDLREGGYRPKDPHWRGAALERQESIERELGLTHARLAAIAEDGLGTAQKKAAVEFRERRQKAAKTAALKEAIAAEEARLEQADIHRRAEGIAKARRMNAGKSDNNAGDSL